MNPDATSAGSANTGHNRFFEVASEVMTIVTLDGRFEDINPAFSASLGWSRGELRGKPLQTLVHHGDRESTAAELAKLRQGATSVSFENRFRTRERGLKRFAWTVELADERFFAIGREVQEVHLVAPRSTSLEGLSETDLTVHVPLDHGGP